MKTHKVIVYTIVWWIIKLSSVSVAFAMSQGGWLVTMHDMVDSLVTAQSSCLLPSYTYIDVHYSNITSNSPDYELVQKAIFLGILPNERKKLILSNTPSVSSVLRFVRNNLHSDINASGDTKHKIVEVEWQQMLSVLTPDLRTCQKSSTIANTSNTSSSLIIPPAESIIFNDVYTKIKNEFVWSGDVSDRHLIQWAIKGMLEAAGDTHTSYFEPTASQNFSDIMQGEFIGIGAYLDMKEPWVLIVSRPIEDSPAAKAWLKSWDRIIKIDKSIVTKDMSVDTAISLIKWAKGSKVKLTITRWTETKIITIVRDTIVVKAIATKEINAKTIMISIGTFSFGIDKLFAQTIDDISAKWYTTIIFDLRNNPGGSLDDVEHMLDYIVPKGKTSVIVRTRDSTQKYISRGVDPSVSLTNKKIIVLINKNSASASEILAGVIRDYAPHAQIVGETSYGKWSVQTLRNYDDGSSLKISTAKWYTGKSDKNIDKIGIKPDINLVDDPTTERDEVLDRVQKM